MQGTSQGVTAAASRPRFSSSDGEGSEEDLTSNGEIGKSNFLFKIPPLDGNYSQVSQISVFLANVAPSVKGVN